MTALTVSRPVGQWIPVKCPHCGKVAIHAKPGSAVRIVCRKCKETSVVAIAA